MLNACYSHEDAPALLEAVPIVVGMASAVNDEAAIAFAASFYRAIGFGHSVSGAFAQGKVSIELDGLAGVDIPTLLCRDDVDPSSIFLIPTRA